VSVRHIVMVSVYSNRKSGEKVEDSGVKSRENTYGEVRSVRLAEEKLISTKTIFDCGMTTLITGLSNDPLLATIGSRMLKSNDPSIWRHFYHTPPHPTRL
jgi:hypothetical protein